MRLLVVEDDPTISRFLVKGLREEQHLVDLAEDGDAAEARALAGDYDAILLDVCCPARTASRCAAACVRRASTRRS